MGTFSGEPLTRWQGPRIMILEEDFYYIDASNKKWISPKGSEINGATIPQPLWSSVGSPYCGLYRRASIVHDVAVGEGNNPDVSYEARRAADRMFYEACRTDGCSKLLAATLYVGVRFGTWSSVLLLNKSMYRIVNREVKERKESPEEQYIKSKFWDIIERAQHTIEEEDLDKLDQIINSELGV